jgi:CubicO group peptidase (beta-lactamase class C family)
MALAANVLRDEPVALPGTKFSYSNLGFVVARWIAERATGMSYEDLMRREVFAPLGITSEGREFPPVPNRAAIATTSRCCASTISIRWPTRPSALVSLARRLGEILPRPDGRAARAWKSAEDRDYRLRQSRQIEEEGGACRNCTACPAIAITLGRGYRARPP